MIRDDLIQSAIVAYLKTKSTIYAELGTPGTNEIREDLWQGREFAYPNIRVDMVSNKPFSNCGSDVELNVLVFSEDASSAQAGKIAGIINGVLNNRGFISQSLHFYLWVTANIIPARSDEKTWRSGVSLRGIVSG